MSERGATEQERPSPTAPRSPAMEESEAPPLPPMELYPLEELSRTCEDCGQKLVSVFKTHADMTRWIAWLNQPEKPAGQSGKVMHLKKPQ
jgi:hypothetical protein